MKKENVAQIFNQIISDILWFFCRMISKEIAIFIQIN